MTEQAPEPARRPRAIGAGFSKAAHENPSPERGKPRPGMSDARKAIVVQALVELLQAIAAQNRSAVRPPPVFACPRHIAKVMPEALLVDEPVLSALVAAVRNIGRAVSIAGGHRLMVDVCAAVQERLGERDVALIDVLDLAWRRVGRWEG